MSASLFFWFFYASCIGLLSLPLLWCWWHLFVLCELHHTFSFSWATHCMTPSDTLHLISPTRSSSFNLSSAVWEPLVPFPFVSSLGHFAGDASTTGFSPSSAENFDPLDPANYLLSTTWFLIKMDHIFGYTRDSCQCQDFKFYSLRSTTYFSHSLKFLLQTKTTLRYVDQYCQPSRLERSSWLKKFNWTFIHGLPQKSSWMFLSGEFSTLAWTSPECSSQGIQVCWILTWLFSFPSAISAIIVIVWSFNSCQQQHSQRPLNESRWDNYAQDLNQIHSSHCGTKQKPCCWKIESRSSVRLFNDFRWRSCWRQLFGELIRENVGSKPADLRVFFKGSLAWPGLASFSFEETHQHIKTRSWVRQIFGTRDTTWQVPW